MRIWREKNAKNQPIGNYRARLDDGRRVNLGTTNPVEAQARARRANAGQADGRGGPPTEKRPAPSPAPPPAPTPGENRAPPAGAPGVDGAAAAQAAPDQGLRDRRDPLEDVAEEAAAGAAGAAAAAAGPPAQLAADQVDQQARALVDMGLGVAVPVCKAIAARRDKTKKPGDLTPPTKAAATELMLPQIRIWVAQGRTPPPWLLLCAGFIVVYRGVVSTSTPIPREQQAARPPAPGEGFGPAG